MPTGPDGLESNRRCTAPAMFGSTRLERDLLRGFTYSSALQSEYCHIDFI
jgi:hypothetical protein